MRIINANSGSLNVVHIDALHFDAKPGETFLLVGHAAQESAYRLLLDDLKLDLLRVAVTFAFTRRDDLPVGTLQGWAFDGQHVRLLGEIQSLAVLYGFSQ